MRLLYITHALYLSVLGAVSWRALYGSFVVEGVDPYIVAQYQFVLCSVWHSPPLEALIPDRVVEVEILAELFGASIRVLGCYHMLTG